MIRVCKEYNGEYQWGKTVLLFESNRVYFQVKKKIMLTRTKSTYKSGKMRRHGFRELYTVQYGLSLCYKGKMWRVEFWERIKEYIRYLCKYSKGDGFNPICKRERAFEEIQEEWFLPTFTLGTSLGPQCRAWTGWQ